MLPLSASRQVVQRIRSQTAPHQRQCMIDAAFDGFDVLGLAARSRLKLSREGVPIGLRRAIEKRYSSLAK